MIKSLIKNSLEFIRKNPTILYSLVLIFAVTGIIFFNSYYSLRKFEGATDKLLQSKALLGEIVFKEFSSGLMRDKEYLQRKIIEIKKQDDEIKDIAILEPDEDKDGFSVMVSTSEAKLFENHPTLYAILWSEEQAVAVLDNDENGRFWNVADIIRNGEGKKVGIALFRLSLSEHDKFSGQIIKNVYAVTILSLVFVLLIIINHTRLFKYEIKAAKLEEIDKMKDDFISMASHELKSPLTAINGYVDLLNEGVGRNDQVSQNENKRYIKNIGTSVMRLRDLVEDILDVSRVEQNRLPIKMEKFDLVVVLNGIADEMKVSADEKKLDLVSTVEKFPEIEADKERVKQIIINLISNAIKYTPSGKVEIKGKEDNEFVYLTVADTGLGMSSEGMKHLFSKFYRIKTNETSGISGTGLGLWISKEIALKMGGDITAESIEGVGSHFTLKLKKAK